MHTVTRRLSNGMPVVLREFRAAPVVSCQLWVKAGSADERAHEAGLAHVIEHMVFKGTAKRKVGEITRDIESAGGSINAWTSLDETVFYVTLGSQYLNDGLEVLGDAVLHPAFEERELDKELPVICEEIRMGKDSPDRMVSSDLFSAMFQAHPYGRPVIGFQDTVQSFTAANLRDFYRRWYTPANMMLIIVGDFNEADLMPVLETHFGEGQKKRSPRRITRTAEPPQKKHRFHSRTMSTSECNLAIGFRIPGFQHEDVAALDVLGALLGQGASSRLELEIGRRLGLSSEISAVCYTPRDEGMFGVFAKAPPKELETLTREISKQIALLVEHLCQVEEVEKAKKLILSEDAFSLETVDGQARKLGYYRLYCDGEGYEERYTNAVRAVTPQLICDIARRYLCGPMSAAVVLPEPSLLSGPKPSWLTAGKTDTAHVHSLVRHAFEQGRKLTTTKIRKKDDVITHVFSSGDAVIIRKVDAPTVAARVAFIGGQRLEPAKVAGVGQLLGALMVRGTESRTAVEIATQMDNWACAISGFSGRNSVGISGEFLREHASGVMALMADCLYHPVFDETELETERAIFKQMVESSLTNARSVAFARFQKTLFGSHPYGRPIYGTLQTLDAIDQKALRQFHRKTVQQQKMALAVVGGVDVDEMLATAEKYFVRPRLKPANPVTLAFEPKAGPVYKYGEMVKEQSHLVIGFPGTTLNSPHRFAMDVMVEILGGHGGRLFQTVREQQSLAYDVSAFSFDGLEPGFMAVYGATSVGKEERFVSLVLEELARIRKVPPTDMELERVKRYLIGSREIAQQRFAARAAEASLRWLYGMGPEDTAEYVKEISKVSATAVRRLASKVLNPNHMIVSVVGKGASHLKFD
ncbi:MAG: insulinase family protein [Deltaproteobacteria bacterium]|nr:insulinase family protein [Deltaproteobacteria bacterium]